MNSFFLITIFSFTNQTKNNLFMPKHDSKRFPRQEKTIMIFSIIFRKIDNKTEDAPKKEQFSLIKLIIKVAVI